MRNVARSGKRDGKNTVLFIHVIVVGLIVVSYCTTMVELASTASEEGGQNESQLVEGSDFFFCSMDGAGRPQDPRWMEIETRA